MQIRDNRDSYGIVTRLLHWFMALAIVAMFALGLWMVTLTYYDPYYRLAPHIHRSVGIILLMLLVFRLAWRLSSTHPYEPSLSNLERMLSQSAQWAFYALLFALATTGYLISTADGRALRVFDWFEIPAVIVQKGLEDTAGNVHEILAYALIGLAVVHAAAALKHHFYDRNSVLKRMTSGTT